MLFSTDVITPGTDGWESQLDEHVETRRMRCEKRLVSEGVTFA